MAEQAPFGVRRALVAAAVLLQCVALGAIGWQREAVVRNGETVHLRTRPVDPRDIFRGDYVRLRYDLGRLPADLAPEAQRGELRKRGRRVYVSCDRDPRGVLFPVGIGREKPADGLFLRGRTAASGPRQPLEVRYGVEKYFTQQGHGRELERGRRFKGVRVALEMAAAVGRANGIAVLRGIRWADMGMDVALPRRNRSRGEAPFLLRVRVVNASERPLAVVDPPGHDSFRLELELNTIPRDQKPLRFLDPPVENPRYTAADLRVLAPGEAHSFEIDLAHPDYRLRRGDEDVAWEEMKYWETARLVYRAPPPEAVAGLADAGLLWQGRLAGRRFSGYSFRD